MLKSTQRSLRIVSLPPPAPAWRLPGSPPVPASIHLQEARHEQS